RLTKETEKAKQEVAQIKEELNKKDASSFSAPQEVQAVVDIPVGTPIMKSMIAVVEVDGDHTLADSFSQDSLVIGKVAASKIFAGETLTRQKLLDTQNMLTVDNGYRAITIPVDSIGGINGAIFPGAHVDVLTTLKDEHLTKTILQDAL